MFYVLNVIKVQCVTMVNISGLCRYTQKFTERSHLCAGCDKRQVAPEHLLQTHSTFTKLVMVSMGVSKLERMDQIFY